MTTPKGYIDIAEAAEKLECSPRTVQRMIETGKLPRYVSNSDRRRVLIPINSVRALMKPIALPERRRIRANASAA